jgi:hypothetical protein
VKLQGIIFRCPVISRRVKVRPKDFRLWLELDKDSTTTPEKQAEGWGPFVIRVGVTFHCLCEEEHSVYLYD